MKYKGWIIFIGIILCSLVGILLLAMCLNEEKDSPQMFNDAYMNYVCRDHHLVCIHRGESEGWCNIDEGALKYKFVYNQIKDVSSDEFIFARTTLRYPLAMGTNLVLHSPNNKVDVLNEWNMERFEVYYIDPNEEGNKDISLYDDREQYIKRPVVSVSDDNVLQELRMLLLDKNEEGNFYQNSNYEDYQNVYPQNRSYYIRVFFEETQSIGWETEMEFYALKEDGSQYVLTLKNGMANNDYRDYGFSIQLKEGSELYKVIWDAVKDVLKE